MWLSAPPRCSSRSRGWLVRDSSRSRRALTIRARVAPLRDRRPPIRPRSGRTLPGTSSGTYRGPRTDLRRRSPSSPVTVHHIEFQVKSRQPPQDVRRNILVATLSRRAVVRLADADIGGPVQQPLEADASLGTGQWCAGAAVNPAPECKVLARVLTLRVKRVGVFEPARIAIGGAVDHHHRAAGGQRFLPDGGRCPRQPEVTLDRALDAKALLDEVRQQAAIIAQPALDVGLV